MNKTLIFCFFLASCAILPKPETVHLEKKSASEVIENTKQVLKDYSWFSAKISGSVEINKNEIPILGSLRIRKDSVIWISISAPIGLEIFRVKLTQDTVQVLNRIEKKYSCFSVKKIREFFSYSDYKEIQAILLGAYYFKDREWDSDVIGGKYSLKEIALPFKGNGTTISLTPKFFINTISVQNSLNQFATIQYGDFELTDQKSTIPKTITLLTQGLDNSLKANLKYSKIDFNIPKKLNFVVPKNYKYIY